MSLIKSFPDANDAKDTSNYGKDSEQEGSGPAACGYIQVQSSNEPAKTNAEVVTTKAFSQEVDLGQHGTSIDAYNHQPKTVNEESGN